MLGVLWPKVKSWHLVRTGLPTPGIILGKDVYREWYDDTGMRHAVCTVRYIGTRPERFLVSLKRTTELSCAIKPHLNPLRQVSA